MEERRTAPGVSEVSGEISLVDRIFNSAIERFKSSPETFVDKQGKVRIYTDTHALWDTIDEALANGLKPVDLFVAVKECFPFQYDTLDALSTIDRPKTWDDVLISLSARVLDDNIGNRMDAETHAELERRWELPDPL